MPAGRPPKGPELVDKFEGSEEAKHRMRLILETIAGRVSVEEARAELGVSESRFHQLRDSVLLSGLEALEPSPPGRPRKEVSLEAAEMDLLRQKVSDLEYDLEAQRVKTVLGLAFPNVVKEPDAKKNEKERPKKKRKKRRKKRKGHGRQ